MSAVKNIAKSNTHTKTCLFFQLTRPAVIMRRYTRYAALNFIVMSLCTKLIEIVNHCQPLSDSSF